jgi:hypothetical protein
MLSPLFSGEFVGHFSGFRGKPTSGSRFGILELLAVGALLLFHHG